MQKFAVAGIVSEYNPFHNGHAWQLQQLRQKGYNTIVCVMSGPFVQRGQPALLPTHLRARAAVAGGADLVLRLPVGYASASAEPFGAAGAGLLVALGCVDVISFGAESADSDKFTQVAAALLSKEFSPLLKEQLATGVSFAAARAAAAERLLPGAGEFLATPNNILGVEYTKALLGTVPRVYKEATQQGQKLVLPDILPLPRSGAAHDGAPQDGIASASWLRTQVAQQGMAALERWVPPACLPWYMQAEAEGEMLAPARWELALLARLRGKLQQDFAPYTGSDEGLAARLSAAARRATSAEQLYALAKTKRFAHSRVRRAACAAALQLPAQLPPVPPFLQVLAASPKGIALLKTAKQTALLPLSTSLAKLQKACGAAKTAVQAEAAAEDLFALCQKKPCPGGRAFTVPAYMRSE